MTIEPSILGAHHLYGALQQEERRSHVDGEHLVPELRGRVLDSAAVGQRGAVGENVEPVELRLGVDDLKAIGDAAQVGCDEERAATVLTELVCCAPSALLVSPADHQTGRAAGGEEPRGRVPDPL